MSARSKTGGGVGTNQYMIQGRSMVADLASRARVAGLDDDVAPSTADPVGELDERDRILIDAEQVIGHALYLIESGDSGEAHEILNRWRVANGEAVEQLAQAHRPARGDDIWCAFSSAEAADVVALIDHPNPAQAVRELPDSTRAKLDRITDTFEYGVYYATGADDPRVSFDHATIDGPVFTDVRPPVRPYTDLYTAIARRLIGA